MSDDIITLSLSVSLCLSLSLFLSLCLSQSLSLSLNHSHIAVVMCVLTLNFLPNDKILDKSKFKESADDSLNVTENLKFVLRRVENIAGKGENAEKFQSIAIKRILKINCH